MCMWKQQLGCHVQFDPRRIASHTNFHTCTDTVASLFNFHVSSKPETDRYPKVWMWDSRLTSFLAERPSKLRGCKIITVTWLRPTHHLSTQLMGMSCMHVKQNTLKRREKKKVSSDLISPAIYLTDNLDSRENFLTYIVESVSKRVSQRERKWDLI